MPDEKTGAIVAHKNGNGMLNLQSGMKGEFHQVTKTGIVIRKGMDQNSWLELTAQAIGDFEFSRDSHLEAMFRVGDLLNYGENEYGEEYAQAIDSTRKAIRLSTKTLQNVAWICGSVKERNRHELLYLGHHEAVAKLNEEDQIYFLNLAEEEELSITDLRRKIKEKYPPKKRDTSKTKVLISFEDRDACFNALEKITEVLESGDEKPVDWQREELSKWAPTVARIFALFAPVEDVAREGAKEIATYLDSPDNGPLKEWKDKRKERWGTALNTISKCARRMGVTACGNPAKKEEAAPV